MEKGPLAIINVPLRGLKENTGFKLIFIGSFTAVTVVLPNAY